MYVVFRFALSRKKLTMPMCYDLLQRLMELDDNTRYGRTIVPLLKNYVENQVIYLHSYFIIRRKVTDQCTIITWETIGLDDLHPCEVSDTALRNDEIGW